MVSDGDRDTRELRDIGERGIFAHTLERALRSGEIDAAVHSSKDLALDDPDDLMLAAWLPRADPRDALVGTSLPLSDLPEAATIATGSARRMSQLRTVRPDLRAAPIRGNVHTRIERAKQRGDVAAVLAMAGLERLGITHERADIVPLGVALFVPEAGQGAVVIQARAYNCDRTGFSFASIDTLSTRRAVQLERAIARGLGGGCEHPVGVHADLAAGSVWAFAAPNPDSAGRVAQLDLVGLELAPLVSVADPRDIDDAVASIAPKIIAALRADLADVL
jgi:hydroxymethylbilane synthase